MTDQEMCALGFVACGWWHLDPYKCNHYASEKSCTNEGGEWRRVWYQRKTDGAAAP